MFEGDQRDAILWGKIAVDKNVLPTPLLVTEEGRAERDNLVQSLTEAAKKEKEE